MKIRWDGRVAPVALVFLMLITASQNVLAVSGENAPSINSSVNTTSTPTAELVNVEGIWNVSLAGIGITMALNQSGDSIYGRCKFEGAEPWNGILVGSLSGKAVNIAINIAMAASQGNVLVSTQMTGTISNDVLQGSYVTYDSEGKEARGDVTGTMISAYVTDYIPAKVEAAPALAPTLVEQPHAIQQPQPAMVEQDQTKKSKIQDVTELARGINANILPWSYPL
jgi:hypothetical protein